MFERQIPSALAVGAGDVLYINCNYNPPGRSPEHLCGRIGSGLGKKRPFTTWAFTGKNPAERWHYKFNCVLRRLPLSCAPFGGGSTPLIPTDPNINGPGAYHLAPSSRGRTVPPENILLEWLGQAAVIHCAAVPPLRTRPLCSAQLTAQLSPKPLLYFNNTSAGLGDTLSPTCCYYSSSGRTRACLTVRD